MADRQIPLLVPTRNFNPTPAMLTASRKIATCRFFRTPMITMNVTVNLATLCIDNEFAPSTTEHATCSIFAHRRDAGAVRAASAKANAPRLIERGHSLVADDLTVSSYSTPRELMATSRPL